MFKLWQDLVDFCFNQKQNLRDTQRSEITGMGDFNFPRIVHLLSFTLLLLILTLVYSPVVLRPPYLPEVGEVAIRNIKANRDLLVEDVETTTQRRQQAASSVPPVYDWDNGMIDTIILQLDEALAWLDSVRSMHNIGSNDGNQESRAGTDNKALLGKALRDSRRDSFTQRLEEEIPEAAYQALLNMPQLKNLRSSIHTWLGNLKNQAVVEGSELLDELARMPFYVVRSLNDGSERQATDTSELLDMAGMRRLMEEKLHHTLGEYPGEVRHWLLEEARAQLRPNLVYNYSETHARRKLAHDAVEPVYLQSRHGQMVVREGTIVTEEMRTKLEAMHQHQWTNSMLWRTLGLMFALGGLLLVGRWFILITSTSFPRDQRTFYLLGAIILISSLLSTVTLATGQGVVELLGWPANMVIYLPLAAMGSALTSLTVGARAGIPGGSVVIGIILSLLGALVTNGGLPLFVYFIIGSLVGGATLRACRRRFDVLFAGVKIGIAQALTVPVIELLTGNEPSWTWITGILMAMASGLLLGLWALALIPLLEFLFNITTDSRLTELASGDHPLIRELSLHSPGTYHHSVMMGNLAEAAAESIQANPLLARVMALYHDIGKMHSPHYFIENQSGENRHDQLTPSMSTKVIMAHVKVGLELARKYKLGGFIQEAIATHHGTSLLQYFYNRALNQANERHETISPEEYRYPGPRPRSREAGILMLADSVEAASRTLKNPVPAQIQALVKRIVGNKIREGQLDECTLTLREVARIEEAFTRVLTLGFYHHRIEYPDQANLLKLAHSKQAVMRNHGKGSYSARIHSVASH
ncbi:HD family phosphohydrolase [Candidatus Magnetaquicoccus inordinatus]|uniref:HD family phosphohydrolase n=1 Tax=Candidatus Magnetaquicoccus inordinatus TaxID=2496818 RepID=UPI00102BC462|nr:HDIG domain-containing metalloprotein [Candidatus Magnetaquicoccus inordinatus]